MPRGNAFTVDRGPDPAGKGEVQQYGRADDALTPSSFKAGEGRRIVEQEQKQVLGDLGPRGSTLAVAEDGSLRRDTAPR